MKTVRWGVVSTGRITRAFVRDCQFAPNAQVVAVASRRQETAEAYAQEFDIPKAYGGYEALWADPDVDAIYIATPHTMHKDQCIAAMRAGKAVMCEKPFTINPAECREVMQVADETGMYCMEAMWTWFLPAIRKARQWLDEGRIGKLVHLKADFGYPIEYSPDKREYAAHLAGGCLLEMGIYPVALALYLTRSNPLSQTVLSRLAPNGVEDDVVWQNRYDGDVTASLATSYRARLGNQAQIIGEDGYIIIPDFFRAHECALYHLDDRVEHFDDNRRGGGFEFQIESISDYILAGRKQSPVVSLTDSFTVQEHMAQIKQTFGASS